MVLNTGLRGLECYVLEAKDRDVEVNFEERKRRVGKQHIIYLKKRVRRK